MMSIKFHPKDYEMLTKDELYEILKLRIAVFVVEQDCIYQDIDNKDKKAMHILGYKGKKLVAYARIFKPGDYFKNASIGRVLVEKKERSYGFGVQLMEAAIMAINIHFNEFNIDISAQVYLENFYTNLGFITIGDSYLEDDIPHYKMIRR